MCSWKLRKFSVFWIVNMYCIQGSRLGPKIRLAFDSEDEKSPMKKKEGLKPLDLWIPFSSALIPPLFSSHSLWIHSSHSSFTFASPHSSFTFHVTSHPYMVFHRIFRIAHITTRIFTHFLSFSNLTFSIDPIYFLFLLFPRAHCTIEPKSATLISSSNIIGHLTDPSVLFLV